MKACAALASSKKRVIVDTILAENRQDRQPYPFDARSSEVITAALETAIGNQQSQPSELEVA